MTRFRNLPAITLLIAAVAAAAGWYSTRQQAANTAAPAPVAQQKPVVDTSLWHAAKELAATADTAEEQELAREALRLADRQLDQAFATALREASEAKPPASGPLREIADYVAQAKARVAADRERIAQLERAGSSEENSAAELELARAQLELDRDELEDAQQDLIRRGGDRRALVDRELQQFRAAKELPLSMPRVSSSEPPATLEAQVRSWLALGDKSRRLAVARKGAVASVELLTYVHDTLETDVYGSEPVSGDARGADIADKARRLRDLSSHTKTLAELDKCIDDNQHLISVYAEWEALVGTMRRGALHAALGSIFKILAVIALALLVSAGIRRALTKHADRRRMHQLRVMGTIAAQLTAVFVALLIIFGPPTQMTTMIGLATAGLTVVLKDFIVAFLGWFVLMGRNGIRVGDWVEIEGVGGEVVEIGVLRTVLLEMGSWSATGNLTGRRVAFVNSFAIERHYFNFSTAGQWLWDELALTLPAGADPNKAADQIRGVVEEQTSQETAQAEGEWERVTRQYGVPAFSAKPTVNLRPTSGGVEAVVRYITRAPRRFEVKSLLFQEIVEVLRRGNALAAARTAQK